MRRLVLLALLASACSEAEGPPDGPRAPRPNDRAPAAHGPGLRDVTEAWGLDFVHQAGVTEERHLPETMGAGAAFLDVDDDGDLDLYLVQGGPLPVAGPIDGAPSNRLFQNDGAGRLTDGSGALGDAAHRGYGMGVVVGDVEGDGRDDLYLTNLGPDALLTARAEGGFVERTAAAGLGDERWTTGAAFLDIEHDGDLDLFVAAYVDVDLLAPEWCGRREPGWRTVCHPDRYEGLQDRLWRNQGDGTFEQATAAAGLEDSRGKGLGVIAVDLDEDGALDLYVANDSVENRLWRNRGDGTFADETLLSGTGVNAYGATEAGMGLAAGDADEDGDIDLYVTNFDHESHTLYVHAGELLFADGTAAAGLDAVTRLPVGFGALMEDLDQDGDLDLAVVNGHIVDRIHLYDQAQSWAQPAQLFLNEGHGRFVDAAERGGDFNAEARVGRGLFPGDLDGDGDLDLLTTACGGAARLFANELCGERRAIAIRGLPPGTRVEADTDDGRTRVRLAGVRPSYLGRGSPEAHLGLGSARLVGLRVRPPGGETHGVDVSAAAPSGAHEIRIDAAGRRVLRPLR